jgi:hypothetical protein
MKFETLEDAVKHIGTLEVKVTKTEAALATAQKGQADAQAIAKDALSKLQAAEDALPKKLTAKVDGKTYEILFGVDGVKKEDLAKDKDKLAVLVKNGSSAIKLL